MNLTKIITAILAMGCIMLGVGLAINSCPAMAAQPQQEWATPPVHKKPVVLHKAVPKAPTKPGAGSSTSVEAPASVVCPEVPPAPVAAPEPRKPSYWERARTSAPTAWDWIKWPLGGLVIGGAITIIFNTGRKVYAGFKAAA